MSKALSGMSEAELKILFRGIGDSVAQQLPAGSLFVLLAFDDTLTGQYISNANRKDIIRAMKEFAEALENMKDTPR
jgi:hypothetical protein